MKTIKSPVFSDLKDLEKVLKIGRRTLREYVKESRLKAKKVGRAYLVTEKALVDFVEARG